MDLTDLPLCANDLIYQQATSLHKVHNREFARRGTHPYAHVFAPLLVFPFVWRGMEKNNKKC